MGNPIYLIILLGILKASVAIQRVNNFKIFSNVKHMAAYVLTIFIAGTLWDYFSVWQGIWNFPAGGTIGLRIGILPIEEFLFFLIVPYFGLVMFKLMEKLTAEVH